MIAPFFSKTSIKLEFTLFQFVFSDIPVHKPYGEPLDCKTVNVELQGRVSEPKMLKKSIQSRDEGKHIDKVLDMKYSFHRYILFPINFVREFS